ncbi:MAG TPA: carboxypeptidase-like regulatory domain-containing protein [Polyangia bacterium]|jgi:hypothetical protein
MAGPTKRRFASLALGLLVVAIIVLVGLVLWKERRPYAGGPTAPPAADAGARPHGGGGRAAAMPASNPSAYEPPGSERLELTGTVIDADTGVPAPDARVLLSGPVLREARTDERGAFRFDRLYADAYVVDAHHEDAAGGPVRVHLDRGTGPVVIRLYAAARLTVDVVDQEKRPIPGATVELRVLGMMRNQTTVRQAKTDDAGRVVLKGVLPGGYFLAAWARGFKYSVRMLEPPAGLRWEATVALTRGSEVHGKVLDDQGRPVAGAAIMAAAARRTYGVILARPPTFGFSPRSDAEGKFVLSALDAGRFQLMADHPGFTLGWSDAFPVDGTTAVTGVIVRVMRGTSITGRVVSAKKLPVPRATVRVGPSNMQVGGGSSREIQCDEYGRFDLGGLPATEMELVAMADGASSDRHRFDLAAKAHHDEVVIPLVYEGTIAGRVVGSDEQPIPDAEVVCLTVRGEAVGVRPTLPETTDAAGRFTCRGLAPGAAYQINAQRPGSNWNIHPGLRGAGAQAQLGDQNVVIVIPADGTLGGRVKLPDGRYATTFGVALVNGLAPRPFTTTDGSFHLEGLAPLTYTLAITVPGFVPSTTTVRVRERAHTDVGTIIVEPPGPAVEPRVPPPAPRAPKT